MTASLCFIDMMDSTQSCWGVVDNVTLFHTHLWVGFSAQTPAAQRIEFRCPSHFTYSTLLHIFAYERYWYTFADGLSSAMLFHTTLYCSCSLQNGRRTVQSVVLAALPYGRFPSDEPCLEPIVGDLTNPPAVGKRMSS